MSKSYPKYKDSGVEWIGEIPEHWFVSKLKRITDFKYGSSLAVNDRIEGKVSVFGSNGIVGYHNEAITEKPCLIIGRKGSFGKVSYSKDECFPIDTTFYIDSTATKNNIKWLNYLLKTLRLDAFTKDAAVPGLSREDAYEKYVPFPDLPEQQSIATYLDRKTGEIDDTIAKKQRLIELLEEERKATINEAVTKGLNPNVKMKDSGIEWIGEIPEHWELEKMKRIAYIKGRIGWQGLRQSEFKDEGPYLITGMNFKNGKIDWDEVYHISEERYNEAPEIQVKEGDILMTKDGTIGKLLYIDNLPGPTSLNSHLLLFRPLNNDFITKFLYYHFKSNPFSWYVDLNKTGTTFYGITQTAIEQYKLALPPLDEQKIISQYLDEKISEIEISIQKIQTQIEHLKEYRQSLIFEAVTGKIDVREEVEVMKNNIALTINLTQIKRLN
jgi:type I restriction enzyme S subunit